MKERLNPTGRRKFRYDEEKEDDQLGKRDEKEEEGKCKKKSERK